MAEDDGEFPLDGITLRGFRHFLEACGRQRGCFTQVKDKFVIEKTTSDRVSYCKIVEEREKGLPRSCNRISKSSREIDNI